MNSDCYASLLPNWGTLFSSDLRSHFALARESQEEENLAVYQRVVTPPRPTEPEPPPQKEPEPAPLAEEPAAEEAIAGDPPHPDVATVRHSAEMGNAMAQYYMGALHSTGENGMPLDMEEAAFWYRKAAEQGLAMAQNNLGFLYATGQGVPQDYVQAHTWIKLAELGHYPEASENLIILNRHMTPEQIEQAEQCVRDWTPKQEEA
ncbi:MAG: sel1 repeat family protein [Magnetococcus sp. YQC-3]